MRRNVVPGGVEAPPRTFTTPDIGVAAYCMVRGEFRLLKAEKLQGGQFQFTLEDPEGKGDSLLLAYANSPEQRFDAAVRGIKKLLYGR